eukprot:scaffold8090_cov267-Pinguiococcus_pyrenoidosus.AAC.1
MVVHEGIRHETGEELQRLGHLSVLALPGDSGSPVPDLAVGMGVAGERLHHLRDGVQEVVLVLQFRQSHRLAPQKRQVADERGVRRVHLHVQLRPLVHGSLGKAFLDHGQGGGAVAPETGVAVGVLHAEGAAAEDVPEPQRLRPR